MAKITTSSTIIPASPGWELAVHIRDEISYEPIIAWEIERHETLWHHPLETTVYRSVIPISAGTPNVDSMKSPWAIKRPDGKIEDPNTNTVAE